MQNLAGGGAERVTLDLAGLLADDGYDVHLLLHENTGDLSSRLPRGVRVTSIFEGSYHRSRLPKLLSETVRQARRHDLVIAGCEGRAGALSIVAARFTKRPCIGWIHNDWGEFRKVTSRRTALMLRLYRHCHRIVAVSKGAAESLSQIDPKTHSLLRVIYNGIDVEGIKQRCQEDIGADHAAAFGGRTIVAAGRLNHQKGFDILIEAVGLLHERGVDTRLVLLGQGSLRSQLEEQANRQCDAGKVVFAGFQPNPYAFMARATAFALSSRFEGFGIVLAEALACGAAVVSTECPSGPSEVLDSGHYGRLVEPGNSAALADALQELLEKPALAETFRTRSREGAQRFDLAGFATEWKAVLTEVASR